MQADAQDTDTTVHQIALDAIDEGALKLADSELCDRVFDEIDRLFAPVPD